MCFHMELNGLDHIMTKIFGKSAASAFFDPFYAENCSKYKEIRKNFWKNRNILKTRF